MSPYSHLNWLGRGLQEMLVSDLAQWPQLEVVSRDALGSVLREQWLQQRGFSSSENPVGLGRLKGVRYLIQGRIYFQENTLSVDLQIVDVETGVVVGSVHAQGVESDIPGLEQDLVTHLIGVFDPSFDGVNRLMIDKSSEDLKPPLRGDSGVGTKGRQVIFPEPNSSSMVSHIDAFLSLEKLTYQRREAYQLAETIWDEGYVIEMGQPLYQDWRFSIAPKRSVPVMAIPFSLFFSPHRISGIFDQAQKSGTDLGGNVDSDGFKTTLDESSGARSLFMEYFQKPRRVFIRALNEKQDVLAIYSDWGWRTEHKFSMRGNQGVSVPMWPNPFVTGLVKFPVDWVERERQFVAFDSVVVPVPDEHVLVVLEPIGEHKAENTPILPLVDREDMLLQGLETLIKSNWAPAVTEGLPMRGYLPGNKRTAVGVVHVQAGKIGDIKFQHWPDDPFFLESLQDLQIKLLGACLECQDSGQVVPHLPDPVKTFRLQLTLVKDISALHLGSRSH
ncbi:CsgG/HfaB family protein [Candidatus Nitrospira allomarina]|uniref:CsgG/HfaB family protein n=1 Tax=Candidatus Nitrospira allomarina TaxID=3020900 RepID=A0AA96GFJ0_9BACT|nr:CsgG/HfaB family protein [Candidatus Nitrospira allomarina]WNM56846.1 CsgG/HfaB family protein [Candidatus Nitrospira allomarina]